MKDRCAFCGEDIPAGKRYCQKCGQVGVKTLRVNRMSQAEADSSEAKVETNIDRQLTDYWMSQISGTAPNVREVRWDECVVCKAKLPKGKNHMRGDFFCDSCLKKYCPPNVTVAILDDTKRQSAKADSGKPILSLVPKQIIYEIEKVRSFGVKKYKDPDNWKQVEIERYHEALLRHTLAVWEDINARDKESGLLHLSHIACNVAFLLEMLNEME